MRGKRTMAWGTADGQGRQLFVRRLVGTTKGAAMTSKKENGERGDYCKHFEHEAAKSSDQTCGALYTEVDAAIAQAQALGESCFR
jgi:hypothetical protein